MTEIEENRLPSSIRLDLPPGAICVPSGDLSRYPAFTYSLSGLMRPHGSEIIPQIGLNIAANLNNCLRRMFANPELQWAWFMGDDHAFEPTTLLRLLAREVDVVVPLIVRRQPPLIPVLFKEPESDTALGKYPPHHWHQLPPHGLLEVHAAGSGGMLIARRVLEAIGDPWFDEGARYEDMVLCKKIRAAGYPIYADLDVQMDHWTPISLRPVRLASGEWAVALVLSFSSQLILPPAFLRAQSQQVREAMKENFGLADGDGRLVTTRDR